METRRTISERIGSEEEFYRLFKDSIMGELMVALPGIVQSFDSVEQTVSVQLALKEKMVDAYSNVTDEMFPLLVDVPIVLPRAGGYYISFPIQKGDECLVIFGDMCIDLWWKFGGIQNQDDKRRHDLSDGFAILGCWSQPNTITNYSTDSMKISNEAGTAYMELKGDNINLVGTIKVNGTIIP